MRRVIRFYGPRGKVRFQTAIVAANTQPASEIESHMTEMTCRTAGSADDHAVNQRSSTNPGTQRQENYITPSARRAPQHFGDQRGACVIIGTDCQIASLDHIAQKL